MSNSTDGRCAKRERRGPALCIALILHADGQKPCQKRYRRKGVHRLQRRKSECGMSHRKSVTDKLSSLTNLNEGNQRDMKGIAHKQAQQSKWMRKRRKNESEAAANVFVITPPPGDKQALGLYLRDGRVRLGALYTGSDGLLRAETGNMGRNTRPVSARLSLEVVNFSHKREEERKRGAWSCPAEGARAHTLPHSGQKYKCPINKETS
ncbi:hypothetical protein BDZ88DRAFT_483312 [Geranomyces variabilis]|nr:hypothetical protein BDZ88DRAFT_483312 [Geranomyces variabilis]